MNATATRSLDVIRRFFHAYLWERDLKSVERCLADDVRWIGTGAFERAGEGFHDFRELLNEEFRLEPGPYPHELSNLHTVRGGATPSTSTAIWRFPETCPAATPCG